MIRTREEKQAERARVKDAAVAYVRDALARGALPEAALRAMIEGYVAMQTTKALRELMGATEAPTA